VVRHRLAQRAIDIDARSHAAIINSPQKPGNACIYADRGCC